MCNLPKTIKRKFGVFLKKRCSYHHVSIGTIDLIYVGENQPPLWDVGTFVIGTTVKLLFFQINQGQPSFYFYFILYCNHILSDEDIVLTLSRIRIVGGHYYCLRCAAASSLSSHHRLALLFDGLSETVSNRSLSKSSSWKFDSEFSYCLFIKLLLLLLHHQC